MDNHIKKLRKLLGKERVLTDPDELLVYESDAMPLNKHIPQAVIIPETTEEISSAVRILFESKVPFVPRGAGTGLSGGCLPAGGGVIILLTRLTRILEINHRDRYAVVEPGVINQKISDSSKKHGLCFAPDPSSGHVCTIGGNVAENSGGPHTIKHGVTANHILGLEVVMPDGEIVSFGGVTGDTQGYDLTGVFCGSEGTFGIITKITVKLIPLPESYSLFYAVFESVDDVSRSITGLLNAGVSPAALEIIDGELILALKEVFDLKFPDNAGAILFIELDGPEAGMDILRKRVQDVCKEFNVREIKDASSPEERAQLWKARKLAMGAIGKISPSYYTQDGVIPRTKLPEILNMIHETGRKYGIRIGNAFHAGDGNIHPMMLYDEKIPGDLEKVEKACAEVLKACVDLGGTISGEHGIGLEKNNYMTWVFNKDDIQCLKGLKKAFDPTGILNPNKIFPSS